MGLVPTTGYNPTFFMKRKMQVHGWVIMLSNICAAAFFGLSLQLDWGLQVFANAETVSVGADCEFEMPYSPFITGCRICYRVFP